MADNFVHESVHVISSYNQQGECVNQQMETLTHPASFEPRYTVHWYVNNQRTFTVENIRAGPAYDMAIPPEALQPVGGNRWHVMMRQAALQEIGQLGVNGSSELAVCYQTPLEGYDTERVVIVRNTQG
jgi:hypothetical protein